ncbi:hypothetical protein DSM104299_00535 [Baekduia alba]|uniref:hypothetical protein n=1 Tax=Baekduia alba TaxID=2997333 RepID=UPI00233FBFB1|nr:hypothetical protein [Baekduia alba]WCB91857.1 hypothetical protein DSM104299_00535 [Baekduia alba]
MFNLDRALGELDKHLPTDLSPRRRRLILALGLFGGFLALIWVTDLPTATVITAVALVVIVKLTPGASGAAAGIPALKERTAPDLVARVGISLDALFDLVGATRGAQQRQIIVAVLDVFELFGSDCEVEVDSTMANARAARGDLPSLTKVAADVVDGLTIARMSRREDAEGRHLIATVATAEGATVVLSWTVRLVSGKCEYRVDDVTGSL